MWAGIPEVAGEAALAAALVERKAENMSREREGVVGARGQEPGVLVCKARAQGPVWPSEPERPSLALFSCSSSSSVSSFYSIFF